MIDPIRGLVRMFLFGLLLFSACEPMDFSGGAGPTRRATDPATQEPASTPSPQPLIKPSLAFEEARHYENQDYGFSFSYPSDFHLEEQPVQPGIRLWLGLTAPDDPGAPDQYEPALGLIIYDNPDQRPLQDWFTSHWGDPPEYGQRPTQPMIFFSPNVENQDPLQGRPALQYESGAWPIRYEKLVEQSGWVIGVYYHRDHPIDYEAAYQELLASLKLFSPAQAAATPVRPTSTSVACLEEQADAETVPARTSPLEVRFISSGNIWIWEEGKGDAGQQVSSTGDATRFSFSPDGQVIAFERPVGDYPNGSYKTELWAVNRDGSDLRRLVSAEQFDQMYTELEHPEAWAANRPRDYRWLPGSHRLTFGVHPQINLLGGGETAVSYWMVDTSTLQLSAWPQAEKIDPYGPHRLTSPDGRSVALLDRFSLSLVRPDGSVIRNNALSYTTSACGEGPCWSPPVAAWTADSRSVRVLVWDQMAYGEEETFTAWEVPADGSPAHQVAVFKGMQYSTYLSPNSQYIAYLHPVHPTSNEHELHLARFDGSRDVVIARGYQLYLYGWLPDSFHLVYAQSGVNQPWLGAVCSPAQPLLDPADTPTFGITWLDATRFLYIQNQMGENGPLRLGQVGGPTLWMGLNDGKTLHYEIR